MVGERHSVLVYGATGYTGRLIAQQLQLQNISFAISGRPSEGLERLRAELKVPCFIAEVSDSQALRAAFASSRVVIGCAGPFIDTGAPMIDAALEAGAHLLDLSGEPEHLRQSQSRDAEARAAKLAIVHSVGFDVVPAELLAKLTATGLGALETLELATSHTFGVASRGTLGTYATMTGEGLAWADSQLVREPLGAHRRIVSFPSPLGDRAVASVASAEVALLPRSIPTRHFRHYAGSLAPAALSIAEQSLPAFSAERLTALHAHLASAGLLGPDLAARAKNHFFLWCQARDTAGRTREMTMQGNDPYGLSAVTAVACAKNLLETREHGRGVLSPLQAFEAQPLLAVLAALGVRWNSKIATNDTAAP